MRIFFTLFALCVSALAWAAPFGHLENVAVKPSLFLADKLAKQQPITYCVELGAKEDLGISRQEVALYTRAALKEWTYGIALQIETAGRSKEFAAVLPLLKNAQFKQVACNLSAHAAGADYFEPSDAPQQADISILVSKNYCENYFHKFTAFYMEDYNSAAPFICVIPRYTGLLQDTDRIAVHVLNQEQKKVLAKRLPLLKRIAQAPYTPADQRHLWQLNRLYSYDGPTYFAAITHELGHAFGLADEYTAHHADPLHLTSTTGQGIMRRLYDPIGCAETEGMLTLLGRYGKGPRAFAGFCQNNASYTDGVEQVSKITPVKRRLSKGVQTLWSLTPDTPKTRTLLYESWGPLDAMRGDLQMAWNFPPNAQVYVRGFSAQDGTKQGTWLIIYRQGDIYRALRAVYQAGKVVRVQEQPVSAAQAEAYFERRQQTARLPVLTDLND